jgi:hypothetical protein
MPRYELGVTGVTAASAAACATIHTDSTHAIQIVEFGLFNTSAVASSIYLGKPANTPVATTSQTSSLDYDGFGSALLTSASALDTAWSTAPTVPTAANQGRGVTLPANIGAGIVWSFYDRPIELLASTWLVVWNWGAATMAANKLYFVWDE